jgi:hypothetical protein
MTLRSIATSVAAAAAAAFIAGCASTPPVASRSLAIAPAPVTFDGNVAGQATDVVFVLVSDANPAMPGFALRAGEMLQLALPGSFKRNAAVAVSADTDLNLVLTKGWAQGAVRLAGQYRVTFDEAANVMKVTALVDVPASGANAPGIKVIHLRGRTFVNPMPGDYSVTVTHVGSDGHALARWQGQLKVLDEAPSARLAPSNFQLPPGENGDFQKVPTGAVAPNTLGLLLWGANGSSLNGVGIAPRDLTRFPKYTGGLLVQDTNGDHRLDPATDKVVGGIIGAAPQGATGQAATSPMGADGRPVLNWMVSRRWQAESGPADHPVQGGIADGPVPANRRADRRQQRPVHDRGRVPLTARDDGDLSRPSFPTTKDCPC